MDGTLNRVLQVLANSVGARGDEDDAPGVRQNGHFRLRSVRLPLLRLRSDYAIRSRILHQKTVEGRSI